MQFDVLSCKIWLECKKSKRRDLDMKENKMEKDIFHVGFELSLLLKGLDGVIEVLGAILFVFINPNRLNAIVKFSTYHELSQDPKDVIANLLINISNSFSVNAQLFIVAYLLIHGLIKLMLVYLLYNKKLWAYPLSIAFLFIFIIYQLYRYNLSHSIFMILLTVFDLITVFFIWQEYKAIKKQRSQTKF